MNTSNSILVILILAIILGGMAVFSQSQPNSQRNTIIPTPTIAEIISITPSVIPTISNGSSSSPTPTGGKLIELEAVGNGETGGQSGIASFSERGGRVVVSVVLNNLENIVTSQPVNIQSGSCDNPGRVVYQLNSLVNGKSETTLNTTLSRIESQIPLAILVRKSTQEANVYTSCGNLTLLE